VGFVERQHGGRDKRMQLIAAGGDASMPGGRRVAIGGIGGEDAWCREDDAPGGGEVSCRGRPGEKGADTPMVASFILPLDPGVTLLLLGIYVAWWLLRRMSQPSDWPDKPHDLLGLHRRREKDDDTLY
jgi:hypothetical protein